jgi:hypothetical protein
MKVVLYAMFVYPGDGISLFLLINCAWPACRDDVVFLIYLYQRWIYRVDMTRVNEFGFSGQQSQDSASTQQQQQPALEGEEPLQLEVSGHGTCS